VECRRQETDGAAAQQARPVEFTHEEEDMNTVKPVSWYLAWFLAGFSAPFALYAVISTVQAAIVWVVT
jgi:hypothetical protein